MAAPHDITCPSCNLAFSTRANRNTLVGCQHCGHKFRAPEVVDPKAATPVSQTPAPEASPPQPVTAPPAVEGTPQPVTAPPAVEGTPPPAAPAEPAVTQHGSVKVVKAGKVSIKQSARPKGADKDSGADKTKATSPGPSSSTGSGAPADGTGPEGAPNRRQVPPPPPNQERAKHSGRRGGIGVYNRHRGRHE